MRDGPFHLATCFRLNRLDSGPEAIVLKELKPTTDQSSNPVTAMVQISAVER